MSDCLEKFFSELYSGGAAVSGRPAFRRALKARPTEFFLVLREPQVQARLRGKLWGRGQKKAKGLT